MKNPTDEYKKMIYEQHKNMMLNSVIGKTQFKQKHKESLTSVHLSTFIDFFKNNPDILNEIIVSLRKDKIEKIRSNVGT